MTHQMRTDPCPHDTDGDGDCGRKTCARCYPQFQPLSVDEMRARVQPGGDLEFVHAGAVIHVTDLAGELRSAVQVACDYGRPTLLRHGTREAVIISRTLYMQLTGNVEAEGEGPGAAGGW